MISLVDTSPKAITRGHDPSGRPLVLFHPDCNRRLRRHTWSADPSEQMPWKALAGSRPTPHTAG